MLAPFGCKCAGEIHHAALGCVIRGCGSDLVAYESVHAGDVDDPAVAGRDHGLLGDRAGEPEGAEEVDLHLVVELLVGDVLGRSHCAGAGIVDEDVYPAETLHHLVDGLFHHGGVGDVAADGQGLHLELIADHLGDFLELVFASCYGNDVASLVCEGACHLHAEAGGAAGDDGYLSGEVEIIFLHGYNLMSSCLRNPFIRA